MRATKTPYGGTPERRSYGTREMSPTMREEVESAREMRADASPKERQEYPAFIPWTPDTPGVHGEGREELRFGSLSYAGRRKRSGEGQGDTSGGVWSYRGRVPVGHEHDSCSGGSRAAEDAG